MLVAYKEESDLQGIPHKSIEDELETTIKSKTIIWHTLGLELPLKDIPNELFFKHIAGYDEELLRKGYKITVISSKHISEVKRLDKVVIL